MDTCKVLLMLVLISVLVAAAPENTAQVEIRAVLIKCALEDNQNALFDDETQRFVREELYKHSVLKDCRKKLALSVKIASDPNNADEYIPIEHVFQGPNKRVRLLNPYVLRLRREQPLQAYRLRKVHTVHGSLSKDMAYRLKRKYLHTSKKFKQRSYQANSTIDLSSKDSVRCEITSKISDNDLYTPRYKRYETSTDENTEMASQSEEPIIDNYDRDLDVNDPMRSSDETSYYAKAVDDDALSKDNIEDKGGPNTAALTADQKLAAKDVTLLNEHKPLPYEIKARIVLDEPRIKHPINKEVDNEIKKYDMYEIIKANIWHTIQVQLFEKLSTPEGKTVWNDLCKGDPARVSSLLPEFRSEPEISVRYMSTDWIPREEFTLPATSMCLAPVDKTSSIDSANQYIVVPRDDIVVLPVDMSDTHKRDAYSVPLEELTRGDEKSVPRVVIRTSRALFSGADNKVRIVEKDGEKYLTLVHDRPYRTQLSIEAQADENQLIHIGSVGRLMTVVSDSSRNTRTVITVQATNNGLAQSRFRITVRDCTPELQDFLDEKAIEASDSIIDLPPQHTESIRIDVPSEIPADVAHCSVILMNDDGHTVAVRDVTIRKGDRCFCVWHCECVCLGEDPNLLCRSMPEARQLAAGLAYQEKKRRVRDANISYDDVYSLDLCVIMFGVLFVLLVLGFVKAVLGLFCRCVGVWGLDRIVQMPRKLERYHEPSLCQRKVVYDNDGWPVHPDTGKRTVRMLSLPMQFMLNLILFITAPCVVFYEALKGLKQVFNHRISSISGEWKCGQKTKTCYSSTDMQQTSMTKRRRRTRIQQWMTPEAQTLTSSVLQKGLPVQASMIKDYMQPQSLTGAIGDATVQTSLVDQQRNAVHSVSDSEADDTEYVLMQMQKSRESLARNQRKLNSCMSTTVNQP